jgi:RHS repeat-associated protein
MTKRFLRAAAWLLLTVAVPICAQLPSAIPTDLSPNKDTGIRPYVPYGGTHENINLTNGNLHLTIPLVHLPGRNGHEFDLSAEYDSKIWNIDIGYDSDSNSIGGSWSVQDRKPDLGIADGWRFNVPAIVGYSAIDMNTGTCIGSTAVTFSDGSRHVFANNPGCAANIQVNVMDGEDTSGAQIDISNPNDIVVSPGDGSKIHFPSLQSIASKIVDADGNVVSFSSNNWTLTGIIDTLGRTVSVSYNSNSVVIGYKDSNGSPRNVTLAFGSTPISFSFSQPISQGGSPQIIIHNRTGSCSACQVLSSIVFANSQAFQFTYNNFGELSNITYPSGGYTAYDYIAQQAILYGNVDFGPLWGDFREVQRRRVCRNVAGCNGQEDTTTYASTVGGAANSAMTATGPDGSYSIHHFTQPIAPGDSNEPEHGLATHETSVQIYSAAGALMQTVATQYQGPYSWSLPTSVTTTLENNLVKQETFSYDTYSVLYMPFPDVTNPQPRQQTVSRSIDNLTQRQEYDYGNGSPGGLLRQTNQTWLHVNPVNNQDYFAPAIRNLHRKASAIVYNPSLQPLSQTSYEYDNYTQSISPSGAVQHDSAFGTTYTTRGNATATLQWRNTDNTWLTTRNQYDDAGNILSTMDPGNHQTNFNYADSWNNSACQPSGGYAAAYLTKVTNALGQATRYTYNSCTGTNASITDPNNQTTSFSYDGMDRTIQSNYPDGGQTSVNYNGDPARQHITKTVLATPNPSIVTDEFYDGLGRVSSSQLTSDPEGADITDTTYDALGRVYSVSNLYRNGAPSPTDGTTYYTYDALGRTTVVTKQDGNTVQTDYSAFPTVTVTDETLRKRQTISDALGRLTEVIEPNPGTGSLTSGSYPTYYSYDALGNLLSVNQVGDGSAPRTRSFSYDSLSRLLAATNPESGTTSYGYDADGNMTIKVTPIGGQTFQYDALHRLTWRGGTGTAWVGYNYDESSNWGFSLSNPIGRLTSEAAYFPNQPYYSASVFSYDAMGRVRNQYICVPSTCTTPSYHTSAQWDLAGHLTSLAYPSGRTIKENYAGAGRLLNVNFDNFNGTPVNYPYWAAPNQAPSSNWGAWSYFPNGAVHLGVPGNQTTEGVELNARLQPARSFTYMPGAVLVANHNVSYYDASAHNNGNVLGVVDNLNNNHTQGFVYDQLNRLTAGASVDNAFNQSFSPDPWGNLKQFGTSAFTPNFDVNNRIAQAGYSYDASGNLLSDTFHQYAYDAESRITSVDSGVTYTYDADGNRVRKDGSGSDPTEYIYFNGEPIAEHDPTTGDWSDYIFANGKRIAKADTSQNRIQMWGNYCSSCGWQWTNTAFTQSYAGTTIQSGDTLYVAQFQYAPTTGGVGMAFSDGTATWGVLKDQDGYYSDADGVMGSWHLRRMDLTPFAGKVITEVGLIVEGNFSGAFSIYYRNFVMVSADGTVRPFYTGESSVGLTQNGSPGSTRNWTIQHAPAVWDGYVAATMYYHDDHLGTSRLMTGYEGWPLWQGTFLPYGQEWNPQLTTNHYKFTGKERDAESGLDFFGARFYSSGMGRWMSPDWADKPEPVPYADLSDPQSLNLYGYVRNNPMSHADVDGHKQVCGTETSSTDKDGTVTVNAHCHEEPDPPARDESWSYRLGELQGRLTVTVSNFVAKLWCSIACSIVNSPAIASDPFINPSGTLLPPFSPGGKTSGVLDAGGDKIPLESGAEGPAASIPRGSRGFDAYTRTHVEGHAAALMRQRGISNATLYINNPEICPNCMKLLPRMLPPGGELRVVTPSTTFTFVAEVPIP